MAQNRAFKNIDWFTVLIYAILVIAGWFNIYAANYNADNPVFFDTSTEYSKQLIWIGLSLIIILFIFLLDSKVFVEISYPLYFISIILLVSVIFFGKEINGARSWFELGPVRFQPVELAKVATALSVSRIISQHGFSFERQRSLFLLGVIWLLPVLCILLQNDTGSALVFFVFILPFYREGLSGKVLLFIAIAGVVSVLTLIFPTYYIAIIIAVIMLIYLAIKVNTKLSVTSFFIGLATLIFSAAIMYAITGSLHWQYAISFTLLSVSIHLIIYAYANRQKAIYHILLFLWGGLAFTASTGYFVNNVLSDYQRTRINVLFGFEDDPQGAGYNVNQSKIAIGSGGITGKGYLQGTQTKYDYVPEQSTDFIYCTVGEEWGFVGSTVVILLFLTLMIRLVLLAERQYSLFSRVYGYCVASIFFFHFAINIGMTIGIAPVIGIPLPFFSYGGSSLWGFTVLLFIFLKFDTNRDELIMGKKA